MAIFDFSSDVNNIDFTKYGLWQAVSCPIGVPQFSTPVEPVGLCNEDTIYNYNGTCYECKNLQNASPKKLMINDVIRWAKMTLYFDENTGSSVSNKTVYYKRPYGTLPTTSKTGHTFNGWFTDETWGTEVTEETICNQVNNHTLYAKLDINYYTITYLDYDGNFVEDYSVAYGTTPPIPTGTSNTAQYSYSWPTVELATADVTYQETRALRYYTITFRNYVNSVLDTQYLQYGAMPVLPNGTPDTTQYDYYWPTISSVNGATTYQETRKLRSYIVTWKDWDGETLKAETVDYGGNGTPPTQPTRTGYTFSNWTGDYTGITGNVTITATYNLNYWQLIITTIVGVNTQTITRTSSPNKGASTGALNHGDFIYYGDVLTIAATASSGYNVSISGSPVTVTGNVTTGNHIIVTYDLSQPILTYVSKTTTSISFKVENQNSYPLRVYYREGGHPTIVTNDGYVDLAADATSGTLTISGLTPGESYDIYARTYKAGSYSTSTYFTMTTTFIPTEPIITFVGSTFNSTTFKIKNTSTRTCTIYYKLSNQPSYTIYGSLAAGATTANIIVASLNPGTAYVASAYAMYSVEKSSVDTENVPTLASQVKPTNGSIVPNVKSVSFTVKNNNPYEAVVHYGLTTSTNSGSVTLAAGATSGVLTISSLTPNGYPYTLYSRTNKLGVYSPLDSDAFYTLDYPTAPTINYVSKTNNSITFTVKNNNPYASRIYYEQNNSTPNTNYVDLAANATSGNLTISGLSPSSSYTIYARSDKDGIKSSSATKAVTTYANPVNPTITVVSKTNTSIVYTVKNNNSYAARVYYEIGDSTPDLYVDLAAGATSSNITASSLTANTSYTIYARSYAYSLYSSNDTEAVTTYANPVAPTITFVAADPDAIRFYLKNNNPYPATIYYEHTDTTPDAASISLAANEQFQYTREVSGLSPSTQYTIYARSYAYGLYSSNDSITATTDAAVQSLTPSSDYPMAAPIPYTTPNSTVGITGDLYASVDPGYTFPNGYYEIEWFKNNVYQGYLLVINISGGIIDYLLGPTTISVNAGDLVKFRIGTGTYSGFDLKADNASGHRVYTLVYEP